MKTPDDIYEATVSDIIGKIYDAELLIDSSRELQLITWSPDPSLLPNAPFEMQHEYNVGILADYCKACHTAIFCVETTQMGNPHYHGFYQCTSDPIKEKMRIAVIKTLQQFGLVKVTRSKGQYKLLNYWTPQANCLYYYKKDVLDSMFGTVNNPINADSMCTIDFSDYAYMFKQPGKRVTSSEIVRKQTQREFYKQFFMGDDPFKSI